MSAAFAITHMFASILWPRGLLALEMCRPLAFYTKLLNSRIVLLLFVFHFYCGDVRSLGARFHNAFWLHAQVSAVPLCLKFQQSSGSTLVCTVQPRALAFVAIDQDATSHALNGHFYQWINLKQTPQIGRDVVVACVACAACIACVAWRSVASPTGCRQ